MDIARINEAVMLALESSAVGSLDDLFALDGAARARAHTLIEELG